MKMSGVRRKNHLPHRMSMKIDYPIIAVLQSMLETFSQSRRRPLSQKYVCFSYDGNILNANWRNPDVNLEHAIRLRPWEIHFEQRKIYFPSRFCSSTSPSVLLLAMTQMKIGAKSSSRQRLTKSPLIMFYTHIEPQSNTVHHRRLDRAEPLLHCNKAKLTRIKRYSEWGLGVAFCAFQRFPPMNVIDQSAYYVVKSDPLLMFYGVKSEQLMVTNQLLRLCLPVWQPWSSLEAK